MPDDACRPLVYELLCQVMRIRVFSGTLHSVESMSITFVMVPLYGVSVSGLAVFV